MAETIQKGDRVVLVWGNAEDVEWMTLKGIVLHLPQGVGDLLEIKSDSGTIHAVNTGCVNFSSMAKL